MNAPKLGRGDGETRGRGDKTAFSPRPRVPVSPRPLTRGASVLEMALVLPILLMLSFGVVDYGYYFYVKNTVQGAALAGAR